ncbi:MAG: ATP-dependent helicase [Candidatus Aenigmarchaeota archaeon]|nr:ATP-dependent helicase [Candidatus Aenigmarchaeota archaeon]
MIRFVKKAYSKKEVLKRFTPIVAEWFDKSFEDLTPPQKYAIPLIDEGKNVLVSSPTGTGKCIPVDEKVVVRYNGKITLLKGKEILDLPHVGVVVEIDGGKIMKIQGLEVLSYDEEKDELKFTSPYVYVEDFEGDILEMELSSGRKIRLTKNHPLLVSDKEGLKWVPAEKLNVGDRVAVVKKVKVDSKPFFFNLERTLEILRKKFKRVLTYEDYDILSSKIKEGEKLASDDLEKIRIFCGLTYSQLSKELKIPLTSCWQVFKGKSKKWRESVVRFLVSKFPKKVEKNEIFIETKYKVERFKFVNFADERLVEWVSFILAEGYVHRDRKGGFIAVSQKNNKYLLYRFLRITKELFGLEFRRKNDIDWVLTSTAFTEFIIHYLGIRVSGRERRKKVPDWILALDEGLISRFLGVFFSLDGEFYSSISLVQSSKDVIESVGFLLLRLGIFPCYDEVYKFASNTREKKRRKYYKVSIYSRKEIVKFLKKVKIFRRLPERIMQLWNSKPSGTHIFKYAFSTSEMKEIREELGISWKEFEEKFGNVYEVVRRSNAITEYGLSLLVQSLPKGSTLRKSLYKILTSRLIFLPIKKVKKVRYKGKLIDFVVPKFHNFLNPEGILLHNTLTAFISIIDELFELAQKGKLEDKVYCIYISPLRALSNDIYRNLEVPLKEIRELAESKGIRLPEIRHAVRTGDTPAHEKQKMLRKPPHILITTPESLSIMITTPKFKEKLKDVKWVIVDEIHSLCENKRGVHLSLSLERLQELAKNNITRIGLSATIAPIEEVAKFLVGYGDDGKLRDCYVVDVSFIKKKDIKVISPVKDVVHTPASVINKRMYEILADLIKKHKTTLIFTNTRSGTERVVFHLKQLLPGKVNGIEAEDIAAHHGSLSRGVRFDVEEKMKKGKLKAVVSSTSLELGIDIGYIDLVVQIGSPKSVTRCLQRIGRSGHKLHEVTKGVMLEMDLDDMVEVSVMIKEAYKNHLDKARIPKNCLDVLAQHLLGMAIDKKWKVDEAFRLIKRSYCYHELPREDFINVLKFLSGGYSTLEEYKVYGKIWFDEKEMEFGRRGKYARVIYSLNIGTIPDEVMIKVYDTEGWYVGNIEEEFLQRLVKGDRFVLGGKVYEFVRARGVKAYVKPAFDSKPTVPSWFSEQLPLSFDLALEIGKFRRKMFEWLKKGKKKGEIKDYLKKVCHTNEYAANSIYEYFKLEYEFLKSLGVSEFPSDRVVLVEKFYDEYGRKNVVWHTLFGRRVNDALSRAFAYVIGKRIRRNVGVAVSDNGFVLILPLDKEVNPLDYVNSKNLREILKKAIRKTEMMKRRFRHCATRGLMILRNYKGHEIKVSRQQANAETLIKVVEDLEDFPIIKETYREILEDSMDVVDAEKVLEWIESGKIKVKEVETDVPSPFAHNIVLIGMSDIVLMEDKKEMLKRLYDKILRKVQKR